MLVLGSPRDGLELEVVTAVGVRTPGTDPALRVELTDHVVHVPVAVGTGLHDDRLLRVGVGRDGRVDLLAELLLVDPPPGPELSRWEVDGVAVDERLQPRHEPLALAVHVSPRVVVARYFHYSISKIDCQYSRG